MKFPLDDYIDEYIQNAKSTTSKKTAQHLKKIIPQTTHLDRNIFNKIIEELKKEIDNGENFKNAFVKIRKKYLLIGYAIQAKLPGTLIRIIVNVREFLEYISNVLGLDVKEIKNRINSKGSGYFIRFVGHLNLASINNNVVFATFDENNLENDPLIDYNVNEIINMLALDKNSFNKEGSLSAIKIKYRNPDGIEKKFPIFLDAGWYDKFFPSDRNDKYGRTRSLDPSLKNMPEIVHQNLKISEVMEDIEFLED
jgi:hypothetical protein